MEKVPNVLIKPFDWRVWILLIALPPMYLLIIAISEYVFNRHVDWWTLIYLTLMPIFMQGVPRLPETKVYNRIFSINWIMPMYVLGLAYLGALHSANCKLSAVNIQQVNYRCNDIDDFITQRARVHNGPSQCSTCESKIHFGYQRQFKCHI